MKRQRDAVVVERDGLRHLLTVVWQETEPFEAWPNAPGVGTPERGFRVVGRATLRKLGVGVAIGYEKEESGDR